MSAPPGRALFLAGIRVLALFRRQDDVAVYHRLPGPGVAVRQALKQEEFV